MIHVLFLCTGNACRSQMAEGWARMLKAGEVEPCSAGVAPSTLDPRAVKVMAEAGVDISSQRSKPLEEVMHRSFDVVVTLCGHARERCPRFPGKTRLLHRGFDDPPTRARGARNEEEALLPYRRVRDAIRAFVENMPENLQG